MKFIIKIFNSTALHISAANENIDIIRLLLQNKEIDITATDEINFEIFIEFHTIVYDFYYLFFMKISIWCNTKSRNQSFDKKCKCQ